MIAYIRGTLAEKNPGMAVVEAAGLGYEVFIPVSTYDRLPRCGEEAKLLVWHLVREDGETLFGFATPQERDMFQKLVQVSGVGPKIALAILSGSSIPELSLAIAGGNAKRISAIKGVGKKTAEKICVELKDKVNAVEALAAPSRTPGTADGRAPMIRDAILALGQLGFGEEFSNSKVTKALESNPDVPDAQTLVKLALAAK